MNRRVPPNSPERRDIVRLRGRTAEGVLKTIDPVSLWACVEWFPGKEGPRYCHLFELEKLRESQGK